MASQFKFNPIWEVQWERDGLQKVCLIGVNGTGDAWRFISTK